MIADTQCCGMFRDVPPLLFHDCLEALAVVAGGEGMLRLVLDLGIEAQRLHRGHHTGQPHHIRVIGVADGLELHTGADEPLQLGKTDRQKPVHQVRRRAMRRWVSQVHRDAGAGGDHPR